jgi:hypothetical protein
MITVFVDTNIILDVILKNERGFYSYSQYFRFQAIGDSGDWR